MTLMDLPTIDGAKVFINPHHVESIKPLASETEPGCTITTISGGVWNVARTAEELTTLLVECYEDL